MSRRNAMCLRVKGVDVLFSPENRTVEFYEAVRFDQRISERRALLTLHGVLALQVMAALWIAQRRQRAAELLTLLFQPERPEILPAWESEMAAFYRCGELVLRRPA